MRSEAAWRREAARRRLIWLSLAFYLALLGEGVLRKWLLPDLSGPLVFLRDPLMVLILLAYLAYGPSRESRIALVIGGAMLASLVLCAACQATASDLAWPVVLAGLRNYALFVPLSFVIRDAFTPADYRTWLRLNLLLALPVAVLVAAQYAAAPSAPINAVPGGGNDGVFLVVEDVVRPYGLFSFALGHSAYAAWMAGVALAVLVGGPSLRIGRWLMLPGVIGIVVMGAFSGSRTYVLLVTCVLASFTAVALAWGPARIKLTALMAVGAILVLATTALLIFPNVLEDIATRQSVAVAAEGSTADRIGEIVTGFVSEAGRVPLFGVGLGAGTNIGTFLATGRTDRVLAEYEMTRVVQELGPLFGGLYIGLRWSFLAWLAVLTLRAAGRGNLQPACFLGFLVPVFLAHDITLQNTMVGIGWFSAGILMSAARVAQSSPTPVVAGRVPRLAGALA